VIRKLNVVVLAGGGSSEREVSLVSGEAVARQLARLGYGAQMLELGADDISISRLLQPGAQTVPALDTGAALQGRALSAESGGESPALFERMRGVDLVFTTMHGARGENGAWQGLLELLGAPYVSAGVKGSAVAMDKLLAKYIMERLGVPTPRYWLALPGLGCRGEVPADVTELVAKPVDQGSSVGIEMVANDDAGWARIAEQVSRFGRMLVEERIHGRELTAGVIGPSREAVALPLVEIAPQHGFYDYIAKYTAGQSEYTCPAQIDAAAAALIQRHALTIYRELDLEPYARLDCLLDAAGQPWFLEANTLPGFTALSLLPRAAQAAGIEFGELLELLMLCALERHELQGRLRHG
jgi:D-alanine-D-alanine ligase